MSDTERIICSAVWFDDGIEHPHPPRNVQTGRVFGGWRHHNCLAVASALYPRPLAEVRETQGFLTSAGRFVTRGEAASIARTAGQIDHDVNGVLTSEDLW